ncbi:hypothetical protein LTR33_005062 [Friedmanniomyces endolithicus]|nr:hypothetical protein LTR33_005062 [Friedmanniomyces endolithicus]
MAIHPSLPGLEISVEVDQSDLPEYDEDESEPDEFYPTACVRYIEAISDARFRIAIRFDGDVFPHVNSNIVVQVTLDCGAGSVNSYEPKHIRQPSRKLASWAIHSTQSGQFKQAMLFSELTISDDIDPDKRLIGTLAALGTIKVEIYKAKFEPRRPRSVLAADTTPPVPHGRISEKLLKGMALTHQATMGPATPHVNNSATHARRTGSPLAIFLFKYRSRSALQMLHLIPRTPSPVPLENRPIDDLSVDDMRELVRRQRLNSGTDANTKLKKGLKREHDALVDDERDESDVLLVAHRKKKSRAAGRRRSTEAIVNLCDDD